MWGQLEGTAANEMGTFSSEVCRVTEVNITEQVPRPLASKLLLCISQHQLQGDPWTHPEERLW